MWAQARAPIQLSDGTLLKSESGHTVVAKSNFANMAKLARTSKAYSSYQLNNSDIEAISRLTNEVEATSKLNQAKQIMDRVNNGIWLVPLLLIPALIMFRRGVVFHLLICHSACHEYQ